MTVTSCLALPTKRPQLSINDAWTVAHKQTSHSLCAIILPGASQRYLFFVNWHASGFGKCHLRQMFFEW